MTLYVHYKNSTDGDYYTVTSTNDKSLTSPDEPGYVGHFIVKNDSVYQCGNYAGDPGFDVDKLLAQAVATPLTDFEI